MAQAAHNTPNVAQLKKRILYSPYRLEGKLPSVHDTQVLRKWIEAISKELKIDLRCTQSMMHRVWKHTSRVVYEFKKLRHGRQQQEYLDKEWKIQLQSADVKNAKDIALEERSCRATSEQLQFNRTCTIHYPVEWELQTRNIELKCVACGSGEWDSIVKKVHESLPSCEVTAIQRIQNEWLWEKYAISKLRLQGKNKGLVNEKELFHVSSKTPPKKIYQSEYGFDFRFARSDTLWGAGIYFAEAAKYSDQYAHDTQQTLKQILLAKVLTGESYYCMPPDSSMKLPPLKNKSSQVFMEERYDSVCGHTKGTKVYVIYDHDKAYPAYLITYHINPLLLLH